MAKKASAAGALAGIARAPRILALASCALLAACSQATQDGALTASLTSGKAAEKPATTGTREELEKATEHWGKAFIANPRSADAAVNYAKNLKAMGERERAVAVLQQASLYHADHKGLASEYGRLALEADQAQLAEQLLARAEDPLKPDWKVISARGAAIAKQGRHREAIPLFERALALSPDNPAIMSNLAMAHAMNGDASKAEDMLRKAAELPGATPKVRQNLAFVTGLRGKFDEARQIASKDMPEEKIAANVAYLQRMVDAPPASEPIALGPVAQKREAGASKVASAKRGADKAVVAGAQKKDAPQLKGTEPATDPKAVAATGWSTEVARAEPAGR